MLVLRLDNPIRRYDWGSVSSIPQILGEPPDGGPQAELWIGAHPDSPSTLPDGRRLDDVVAGDAPRVLGAAVRAAFGDRLPYLAKILAAATPLSLQVHPDADQAALGFADEEARGVPADARERRYRDPFHKPEMVIALEPFEALCGWRDPAASRSLLAEVALPSSGEAARATTRSGFAKLDDLLAGPDPTAVMRAAVGWLLSGADAVRTLVHDLGSAAAASTDVAELATVADLARLHPDDPGVVVALLLNRVTLTAGEALYLPAGNVHAYLCGTAVEVMASSDNVLRAGLTTKHVDTAELLRTVDWTPRPLPRVVPVTDGAWRRYRPGAVEFEVAMADAPDDWVSGPPSGPRIVLALDADIAVRTRVGEEELQPGRTVLVPAEDGPLQVRGSGTAVVVAVPGAW